MYRNPQNSNVVDDIYGHSFQFPSFSIYNMWVFLGIHSILGPFKLSIYNHFLKWSYPKMFKMNCVFHGKSLTKMDENWGYPQRNPNFRLQNLWPEIIPWISRNPGLSSYVRGFQSHGATPKASILKTVLPWNHPAMPGRATFIYGSPPYHLLWFRWPLVNIKMAGIRECSSPQ